MPPVEAPGVEAAGEIDQVLEPAAAGALGDELGHRLSADALDRGERIADRRAPTLPSPASGGGWGGGLDREGHFRAVDVRRQQQNAEPVELLAEDVELVGVAEVQGHQRGEELDRVVRLQIGRLIGDQRISGGMRLVETVAGEFRHLLEDLVGEPGIDAARGGALDKQLALRLHLGLDLLAHRAAQQIGAAEAVARQHLGDLHHLLLVDHDAVGFLQDPLERRMQVVGGLLAVLDRDVARDVLHRPRAVERDDRDDVLEAVGPQLFEHVAHARAFELEHADRVAARQAARRSPRSSSGKFARSSAMPRAASSSRVRASTVSVLRPRKSNFTRPASSTHFMLNWVTGMSERGSR